MTVLNEQVHLDLQARDVFSHLVDEQKQRPLRNQRRGGVCEN